MWRRWLAFELKRLREERDLTQKAAAKEVRKSHATVSLVETAKQGVSVDDIERYLDAYRVPDGDRPQYREAAVRALQPGWWERYSRDEFPRWLQLYVGLEHGAASIRSFHPLLISGLLQTPEYARALFESYKTPRTKPHIDRLVDIRVGRQAILTREPEPTSLSVVMTEAAIRADVGGSDVMGTQLARLIDVAEYVEIRILPFDRTAVASESAFALMSFPWPDDPGMVYVETPTDAHYIDDRQQIDQYLLGFNHLCVNALSPEASTELIRQRESEMR